MFEYLKGKVEYKKPGYVALDVNNVGYKIHISLKSYEKISIDESIRLYIYNHIKEDEFKLIGFLNENDRMMFQLLLGVSGIGVSLALSILSSFEIEEIQRVVLGENFLVLKKVPKLGEKKAKQIILDLQGKMSSLNLISTDTVENVDKYALLEEEIYLALEGLGYGKKEIDKILTREEIKSLENIETAIKYVLKKISSYK
jgi:Holliday junction DNA helicase RuvA